MKKSRSELKSRDFRRVLFVRALEAGFGDEALAAPAVVDFMSASRAEEDVNRVILERAVLVDQVALRRHGISFEKFIKAHKKYHFFFSLIFMLTAFFAGMTTNYLSGDGKVNLLLNPMVILFFWNTFICLFRLAKKFLGKIFFNGKQTLGLIHALLQKLGTLFNIAAFKLSDLQGKTEKEKAFLDSTRKYYQLLWKNMFKLEAGKIGILLNLSALFLGLGAVAGLYLRGTFVNYQFYLGSTFISDGDFLADIVNAIYAPVSFIFSYPMPWAGYANEFLPGAGWIHLMALASLIYILFPRLLVILLNLLSLNNARKEIQLDYTDLYSSNILQKHSAALKTADIYFYGHNKDGRMDEQLIPFLAHVFKTRFESGRLIYIPWAGEVDFGSFPNATEKVIVFNGIQTPEEEVHGQFVRSFIGKLAKRSDLVAIVVTLRGLEKEALQQRQQIWEELFHDPVFEAVHFLVEG